MIRPATHDDLPRILALGAVMHQLTDYAARPFDPERAGLFLRSLIDGAGVIFLAEVDGEVIGGIAGAIGEHWYSDERFAYEIAFFLDPKRRHGITAVKLLRSFVHWSRARGAKRIQAGVTTGVGVSGVAQLYQAVGFRVDYPMFEMELTND